MGEAELGMPFDIHTGGIDHREIHHPNEIAQNQAYRGCGGLDCAEHSGARLWMHNNFLIDRGGKMSKSAGEFLRSEEHTSELQSLMRISYAVFCLKKKKQKPKNTQTTQCIEQHTLKKHQVRQHTTLKNMKTQH